MWRRLEPHVLEAVTLRVVGVLPTPSGHGGGGAVRLRPQLSGKMATLLELLLQVQKSLSSPHAVITRTYYYRSLLPIAAPR